MKSGYWINDSPKYFSLNWFSWEVCWMIENIASAKSYIFLNVLSEWVLFTFTHQFMRKIVRCFAIFCDEIISIALWNELVSFKNQASITGPQQHLFFFPSNLNRFEFNTTIIFNLRSELHNPASRQRFAPILEAYCTYCGRAVLSRTLQDVRVFNKKGEIAVTIKTQNSLVSRNCLSINVLNILT